MGLKAEIIEMTNGNPHTGRIPDSGQHPKIGQIEFPYFLCLAYKITRKGHGVCWGEAQTGSKERSAGGLEATSVTGMRLEGPQISE